MPLVLYTWIATLKPNTHRSDNVVIFVEGQMAAKVVALDDPLVVCSLHLTTAKRVDSARSCHHEVGQRVQARVNETRLAQCELWIQYGMPMWVEDEKDWYADLEVPSVEEASQKALGEVADEELLDPKDYDDTLLPQHDRRSPPKLAQVRAFHAGYADEDKPEASHVLKPKKATSKVEAQQEQTTLTHPRD